MSASQTDAPCELHLLVNGAPQVVPAPCSVQQLLEVLGLSANAQAAGSEASAGAGNPPPRKTRVAVAVNREVVLRSRYDEAHLAEGDRVEILEAVGGG